MNQRSVVTTREPLCAQTLYASPQAVVVHAENLVVETERRIALVDLTDTVSALVQRTPVSEGSISLWPLHTTCVVLVNELQTALVSDVWSFLEQLAPREHAWMHNNPAFSDCDRFNADSHLRALLLGQNPTLQISGGAVVLGHWQRILLAELDGPRARTIRAQVWGIGDPRPAQNFTERFVDH